MEFLPIFTEPEHCSLWAVRFDGESEDIFNQLFNQWNDTEYLTTFFEERKDLLADAFWGGLTIDAAIERVLDEAEALDMELHRIDTTKQGSLGDIFKPLHRNKHVYSWANEQHRKGKAYKEQFPVPLLRLYAIELEDGTLVVTGGAIKLKETMDESEKDVLQRVQEFLTGEGISDRLGLIQS